MLRYTSGKAILQNIQICRNYKNIISEQNINTRKEQKYYIKDQDKIISYLTAKHKNSKRTKILYPRH